MTPTVPSTRQIRRATARQSPEPQLRRLTEQVMTEAEAKTAEAQAAARVTRAHLTDAELHAWRQDLEARLQVIQQHPEQNLGHIEEAIARTTQETLRLVAQRAAQAKAQGETHHHSPPVRSQSPSDRQKGGADTIEGAC